MSTSKISIIIPVYNQAGVIGKCLNSIFNQTLKDFEVIIVNDGSTDNLLAVLQPWQEKVKIYTQSNKGAPTARNFGFSQSQGDYLLFCDADIILAPDALQKMYQALQDNPDSGYAYSSFRFGWKKFKLWPFDEARLKQMPYIHTTSLIRRECFTGFDENLKKFQDWDLWLTMLEAGHRGIWINEVLFRIISKGTISSWLPKIFFRLPVKLDEVQKYNNAKQIILEKHKLL